MIKMKAVSTECGRTVSNPVVVMKRYEMKYILTAEQTAFLRENLVGHMETDRFGLTSIASLYYDTPDRRLIRNSIEKTDFKEKIRLRSYGLASESSPVFLELKRKTEGVVYKRRVQSTVSMVRKFFEGEDEFCADSQIGKEISYFRDYYQKLVPSCLIIYDRIAYYEPDGDLRLTIDYDPRYRAEDLTLTKDMKGQSLLPDGSAILEIKVQQAVPLWLTPILSKAKIYTGSFSKYGAAYQRQMSGVARKGEYNV